MVWWGNYSLVLERSSGVRFYSDVPEYGFLCPHHFECYSILLNLWFDIFHLFWKILFGETVSNLQKVAITIQRIFLELLEVTADMIPYNPGRV